MSAVWSDDYSDGFVEFGWDYRSILGLSILTIFNSFYRVFLFRHYYWFLERWLLATSMCIRLQILFEPMLCEGISVTTP